MARKATKRKKSIVILDVFYNDLHNNASFMGGGQKMILKFYELLKDKYDISVVSSQKFFIEKAKNIGIKTYDAYAPANEVIKAYEQHLKDILEKDLMIINNQITFQEHPNVVSWV
ncbi:MAG: glycosyl transferase group 1, partial [Hydrogenobaculum sp.]